MLKKETIQIDGLAYEVREQSMRVLRPILVGNPNDVSEGILEACVFLDDVCIGDKVLDFGLADYQNLMLVANRVHGMDTDSAEVDDSGEPVKK